MSFSVIIYSVAKFPITDRKGEENFMRLRKEQDEMMEEEVLLIAKVSDALAHPARINIFRYIMQSNRAMVATKTWLSTSIMLRPPFPSIQKSWWIQALLKSRKKINIHIIMLTWEC